MASGLAFGQNFAFYVAFGRNIMTSGSGSGHNKLGNIINRVTQTNGLIR